MEIVQFDGLSLRFAGNIQEGRFEFTCNCGRYSGVENRLTGGSQILTCEHCGAKYEFVQQKDHFHLLISPGGNKPLKA